MSNPAVEQVLKILREEFTDSSVTFIDDGTGGGNVIVEPVDLGPRYSPTQSWIGAHLSSALPFADIYPLFIGSEVAKADGSAHQAPITPGHNFAGRSSLQISKRTNNLMATSEGAAMKFLKVLHYIKELAP